MQTCYGFKMSQQTKDHGHLYLLTHNNFLMVVPYVAFLAVQLHHLQLEALTSMKKSNML
jgi:hypothetical protein